MSLRQFELELVEAARRYGKHLEQFGIFYDMAKRVVDGKRFAYLALGPREDQWFLVTFTGNEWLIRLTYDAIGSTSTIFSQSVVRSPGAPPVYTPLDRSVTTLRKSGGVETEPLPLV